MAITGLSPWSREKMSHAKARSREKKGFEFNPPFAPSRLRARSPLPVNRQPVSLSPDGLLGLRPAEVRSGERGDGGEHLHKGDGDHVAGQGEFMFAGMDHRQAFQFQVR